MDIEVFDTIGFKINPSEPNTLLIYGYGSNFCSLIVFYIFLNLFWELWRDTDHTWTNNRCGFTELHIFEFFYLSFTCCCLLAYHNFLLC
jgi:hypothetical protein